MHIQGTLPWYVSYHDARQDPRCLRAQENPLKNFKNDALYKGFLALDRE
jgi:hypothetical protein